MNQWTHRVGAGAQMDGTAGKGGFTEAGEMHKAQGHYLFQVAVRVGAAMVGKTVSVFLRTAFGDVPVATAAVAAVDEFFFLGDFSMCAGPGEYFVVKTTNCVTEVFATIYTVAAGEEA